MKTKHSILAAFCLLLALVLFSSCARNKDTYTLQPQAYNQLPLGSIKPAGWLRQMLVVQRDGATGHLDELYPLVMGKRNGWLGGDGDQWERGPYWIDGLLPLAYTLGDSTLIAKVQPWIEWTLASQRDDGYFGPMTDYEYEPGLQRDNCRDWWPKMVMLKVLMQYQRKISYIPPLQQKTSARYLLRNYRESSVFGELCGNRTHNFRKQP